MLTATLVAAQTPTFVQEIRPGGAGALGAFKVWNKTLYFYGRDGSTPGMQLWAYDELGPAIKVPAVPAGLQTPNPAPTTISMEVMDGNLYFVGRDTADGTGTLFVYDGMNPAHQAPGTGGDSFFVSPSAMRAVGGKLYFLAGNASPLASNLWMYDGRNRPVQIAPLPGGLLRAGWPLVASGGKLYFPAGLDSFGIQILCALDPATDGWSPVPNPAHPAGFAGPKGLLAANGQLYFGAFGDGNGSQIWSYDGVQAKRITTMAAGFVDIATNPFAYYRRRIYFIDGTSPSMYKLFACDPATGNAEHVTSIGPTGYQNASSMYVYKGSLYFNVATKEHGDELWRYDGDTATLIADLRPGPLPGMASVYGSDGNNRQFAELNGRMYFAGQDGVHLGALFVLDDPSTGIRNAAWKGRAELLPNPVRTEAYLLLELPAAQRLGITLGDIAGRTLERIAPAMYGAGRHEVALPVGRLPAGRHVYRVEGPDGRMLAGGVLLKE